MNDKTYGIFATDANKKVIESLTDVIVFPKTEIELISFESNILHNFDWLVFLDIFSVESFLQTLETQDFDFFELDMLRVCACGESISDKLRFKQLHADVIPQNNNVEMILQAICDYENPQNLKFLIANQNTKIAELLTEKGAEVVEISTYQHTEVPNFAKLKSLLNGGAIDEFIFTSPEDVFALNYFGNLADFEIKCVASNEITFQTLREFGIKPTLNKK